MASGSLDGPKARRTPDDTRGSTTVSGVSLSGIYKSFAGRPVLSDVAMDLFPGEVHALVGANGAGKSTLIKVLAGNHGPDMGLITIRGKSYANIASPQRAAELGIRVVHQETPLFDTLSVAESVGLFRGYPTGWAGRVRWNALNRKASSLLSRFGVTISTRLLGGQLSAAERALVSVAMALGNADQATTSLLILDEASAAVPEEDAEQFLRLVRRLAEAGTPVLMVTHRLGEVAVADRVTVLNDGRVTYQGTPPSRERLVMLITGADDDDPRARPPTSTKAREHPPVRASTGPSAQALTVAALVGGGLRGVDFTVKAGECLGFVGTPDSGVADLPLALIGAVAGGGGRISVFGVDVDYPTGPRAALRAGLALVPRDRMHQGGVGGLSVAENLLLPAVRRYWHRPGQAHADVQAAIDELDIRPSAPNILFRELSGGNQQKVIVGKWLNCRPRVLILDDPTVGVDPGARRTLFDVLRRRATEDGLAMILMTSEPEQLVEQCNRVMALSGGRIVEEISGPDMSYVGVAKWASA